MVMAGGQRLVTPGTGGQVLMSPGTGGGGQVLVARPGIQQQQQLVRTSSGQLLVQQQQQQVWLLNFLDATL